jgi:hypothetical protein
MWEDSITEVIKTSVTDRFAFRLAAEGSLQVWDRETFLEGPLCTPSHPIPCRASLSLQFPVTKSNFKSAPLEHCRINRSGVLLGNLAGPQDSIQSLAFPPGYGHPFFLFFFFRYHTCTHDALPFQTACKYIPVQPPPLVSQESGRS